MRPIGFAGLLLAGSIGCAARPTPGASGSDSARAATSPNRNRDVITREELAAPAVRSLTVLAAVKTLRPHFLTVRGVNTVPAKEGNDPIAGKQMVDQESGKVHASIDGNKIVPIEELAGLSAGTVVEVRLLSPAAAMQRFGGSARQGPVILVKTM